MNRSVLLDRIHHTAGVTFPGNRASRWSRLNLCWGVIALWIVSGCGGSSSNVPPESVLPPLTAMNKALRQGDLEGAWEFSDEVLSRHADDAKTITVLARMAHDLGKSEAAAELLVKAARADSFLQEARTQQAMIAMVGVGRLYDGMAMLEEAVEQQPEQHATRRWLYDFYIGTENRMAAIPHGRYLVRQRRFDLELLTSLSNAERRTLDTKPLEEMTSRNPNDKRPLLGEARKRFDARDFDGSLKILGEILDSHPNDRLAKVLQGRVLASAGRFDELSSWADHQGNDLESFAEYWLAIGDWARQGDARSQAVRAYWEATRRDPDMMEAWSKLSSAMQEMQRSEKRFSEASVANVQQRATLLSKLRQSKHRFERTGNISRETAIEIVFALRDLGRLWEAEAWAAIATTLPEDDAVSVDDVRKSVMGLLQKDTPWQQLQGHPELQLDLSHLELPAIVHRSDKEINQSSQDASNSSGVDLSLINEASQRGLDFFGRTGDQLHMPGIMLYQTLGCGGATIDFDLDGWSDLYLASAGGTPAEKNSSPNGLFRNLQGQFQQCTAASLTGDKGFGQGVAVGDVNEDGFPDLLILNYGPNTLLINNGDGTFSDASDRLPDNANTWSASAALADVNADAICDAVIVNYCDGIEPATEKCVMNDAGEFGSCTPMAFPAAPDVFLQGTADGNFVNQTSRWDASPSVLGRGLGIVAGALDGEVGVDLFVANDMTVNHFWSRTPDTASFRLADSAIPRGLGGDDRALAQGSMGIATGDLDHDGDIDFYVTNFFTEYNTLHAQRGAGFWQDRTSVLKLGKPTLPWVGFGTEAVDLDLDAELELVVSNGHVDMFSRDGEHSIYAHPMQVFRRNESQAYDSIGDSIAGEYLSQPHVGRALWTIDANRDRMTDLVVTHQTEPTALLINRSARRGDWIEIQLVGRECSRDAIGAVVIVEAGDQSWVKTLTSGDGYLCSNERMLRFGLGALEEDAVHVRVDWPDGSSQTHTLSIDRSWLVVQSDSAAFQLSADESD